MNPRLQRRARVVAHQCAQCPTPCAQQHDATAHADPCAQCPLTPPKWGPWDCSSSPLSRSLTRSRSPSDSESPSPAPTLLRILRGWRRAGLHLKPRAERRAIAPLCEACDHHTRDPATGLPACAAGCNCGVAAVTVYRAGARCKRAKW